MTEKVFITSDNVAKYAQLQGTSSFTDRGEVVLVWDELSRSEKNLAKNIEMDDIQVRTSDPRSVPDKWTDNIVEEDGSPEAVDLIKQVIANPARYDVYTMLEVNDPPEPLMLWWLDKTFSDPDYFMRLSDVLEHALFMTDTKYIWAVVAFGVDAGEGRFYWPESEKETKAEKSVKEKVADKYGMRKSEVEKVWECVPAIESGEGMDLSEDEAKVLGVTLERSQDQDEKSPDEEEGRQSSLLDL